MNMPPPRCGPRRADVVAACRLAMLAAVLCLAIAQAGKTVRAQDLSLEAAVKATYLVKFPPFVEWPAGAITSPDTFTLCIVGNDPFGTLLDRAASGQRVAGRAIVIRRLPWFTPDSGCQVVFTSGPTAPATLAALRGKPILSVTDEPRDGQPKGILNFLVADNRVRFEVDDQAAAEAGLTISSKLLGLAIHVRTRN